MERTVRGDKREGLSLKELELIRLKLASPNYCHKAIDEIANNICANPETSALAKAIRKSQ